MSSVKDSNPKLSPGEDEDLTVIAEKLPVLSATKNDRAYLIILSGSNVGEMYKLDKPLIMGRGQIADIRVTDEGISRQHARVYLSDASVLVEDLGSTNGTFVNGSRVGGRVSLTDGDKIQLGSTTILKFTYHDQLEEQFQKQMYESALRDGLTKLFNRRYFLDRLESEFAYMQRHQNPLALLLFDIDYFKRINDTYGHPAGDYVLTTLSAGLNRSVRAEDVFARYGGEEFVFLCRGINLSGGVHFAERMRTAVMNHGFVYNGVKIPVTISLGVAAAPDARIQEPAQLITLADEALYQAKGQGRNRVVAAEPR